jgi:hypothetical protein
VLLLRIPNVQIVRTVTDDDVGGSHLLPRQSGTVHSFSRVTSISSMFCSPRTTSLAQANKMKITWRHVKAILIPSNVIGATSITWPTTCLRRSAEPTTSSSSHSCYNGLMINNGRQNTTIFVNTIIQQLHVSAIFRLEIQCQRKICLI